MLIRLDAKTIADEIMALSALRAVTAGDGEASRLLTRDNLPGLRVIMRMVFAEAVLGISGYVEECGIDDGDPQPSLPYDEDSPLLLEVTLRDAPGGAMDSGKALVVKRHLEHVVAAGTLGWVATDADAAFAALLQQQREGALSALLDTLASCECCPAARDVWP